MNYESSKHETSQLTPLERRLESDADRLTGATDPMRVKRIMEAVGSMDETRNHSVAPSTRPAVIGRIGKFAPLAIAAAFALVAAPIIYIAVTAQRATPQQSPQQQAAAIRSAFMAFENVRLPDLPPQAKQSFTKALEMASPEGMRAQTQSLLQDGRRIAEHFLIPIPPQLLPKDKNAAPEEIEAPPQTGMAAPPTSASSAA